MLKYTIRGINRYKHTKISIKQKRGHNTQKKGTYYTKRGIIQEWMHKTQEKYTKKWCKYTRKGREHKTQKR